MILESEELRRLQLIELELLKAVIAVCDELNLKYYVLGGTMLGAVRHKGFIPWDDDIDVGMPRADYEKFLEKAPELLPGRFFLQSYRADEEYYANIAKLRCVDTTFVERPSRELRICHGVFIDVFPLDNYPSSGISKLWYKIRNKALSARIGKAFIWDKNPNMLKELLKQPLFIIWPDVKQAVAARERLFASFPYNGMIANYCGQWGEKEIVPAEWYGEGCDLEFEGLTVKAPKEYHKWLTQVYGNYMQLPSEKDRVGHHDTAIFDLDKPYTEYYK